jgi:hypothetical protein
MDLKEICENKGGKWLPDRLGCEIDGSLFLKTKRSRCIEDGDSFEDFKDTGFMACREVPIKEYCKNNVSRVELGNAVGYELGELLEGIEDDFQKYEFTFFEVCFSKKLPQKKITQSLDHVLSKFIGYHPSAERMSEELFKNNVFNEDNINKVFLASDSNNLNLKNFFENKNQKLTNNNIRTAIDNLNSTQLSIMYQNIKIDEELLVYAIEKEASLEELYRNYEIKGKALDAAIDKKQYYYLLVTTKMSDEQVGRIMDNINENYPSDSKLLETLYESNDLNYDNVSKAMKIGKYLKYVYENPMTAEQIDTALDIGMNLYSLYTNQKTRFTGKQKYQIISKGKELNSFYATKIYLTSKMIDTAIERGAGVDSLYTYYILEPYQIDKAMDVSIGLSALYHYQTLSKNQVDKALEKQMKLDSLYAHQKLDETQVDEAIKIDNNLSALFANKKIKMTSQQITNAIKLTDGNDLWALYITREVDDDNIQAAFENPSYIAELYENHKLNEKQVEKAIDLGINLETIYEHQDLNENQLRKTIFTAEDTSQLSIIYKHQDLPQTIIDKIITDAGKPVPKDAELDRLLILISEKKNLSQDNLIKVIDTNKSSTIMNQMLINQNLQGPAQQLIIEKRDVKVLKDLFQNQEMTQSSISKAIERGEELPSLIFRNKTRFNEKLISKLIKHGVSLHEGYEHLSLTSKNIDEAIDKGIELENLISNQPIEEHHIERLIDLEQHLSLLLEKPAITQQQKERIYNILYAKYGFTGKREGKVLSHVPPEIDIIEFLEVYNTAIENKIKDDPLKVLVGVFPLKDKFSELRQLVEDNKYEFKDGIVTYIYSGDKKIRLGRFLERQKRPDLLKLLTTLDDNAKKQAFFPQDFDPMDYELVISNDPQDIAIRSTGMRYVQDPKCESIGNLSYGGGIKKGNKKGITGAKNGWRDDIMYNNLVAILKHKKTGEWHARAAIRWCNREDDGLPDALVEHIYTKDLKKQNMTETTIFDILNKNGFTGRKGTVKCITPYKFTGYVDSDFSQSGKMDQLILEIGERPEIKGESE